MDRPGFKAPIPHEAPAYNPLPHPHAAPYRPVPLLSPSASTPQPPISPYYPPTRDETRQTIPVPLLSASYTNLQPPISPHYTPMQSETQQNISFIPSPPARHQVSTSTASRVYRADGTVDAADENEMAREIRRLELGRRIESETYSPHYPPLREERQSNGRSPISVYQSVPLAHPAPYRPLQQTSPDYPPMPDETQQNNSYILSPAKHYNINNASSVYHTTDGHETQSNDRFIASPENKYFTNSSIYPLTSSYLRTPVSTIQAQQVVDDGLVTEGGGPRMIAPPKPVQSIYASYAPPARTNTSTVENERLRDLNVSNLKLLDSMDRFHPVGKLPAAMFETSAKCYVQGFKKSDGTLIVRKRATTKPVHFRECYPEGDGNEIIVFHVQGSSDVIILDGCQRMRVMVDSILTKAVLIGCHNVEIVVGGHPPQMSLVACSNCCIATSKDDWMTDIETVGCTGISVLISKGGGDTTPVKNILQSTDLERVLLPDALLTAVRKGTVATQCHYIDGGEIPPLLAPRTENLQPPPDKIREQIEPLQAPQYAVKTHETNDYKVEYVADICSVGVLIKNDHIGTRITELENGGTGKKSGMMKVGDYLMTVDNVDIRGYSVPDIHTLLLGPKGTSTFLGMCRLDPEGNLAAGYDVVLKRWPLEPELEVAPPPQPPPQAVSPPQVWSPMEQHLEATNALSPSRPIPSKTWRWTPKVPTPGQLGALPSVFLDKETEEVLQKNAKLPPPQGIIVRSATGKSSIYNSALSRSPGNRTGLNDSGISANGTLRSAGVGMAVQQGPMGLYVVSAVAPGGPAETSGQIKKGDIVHSINNVVLAGQPPQKFKDLVWGDAGTEVMVALLRPEAEPDDVFKELTEFEWWRPVLLIRSLRTRPVPDTHADGSAPLPSNLFVSSGNSGLSSLYQSMYKDREPNDFLRQQESLNAFRTQESLNASQRSQPKQNETFVSATAKSTLGSRSVPKEVGVGVALWLDESFEEVAGTEDESASFRARLTHDLANALAVRARQVNVAGLQAGSVVAQIELHACEDGRDDRSPMILAAELVHQAEARDSRLRSFKSTRRAVSAKILGPLSTLRPEPQQQSPVAWPTLVDSPSWQVLPETPQTYEKYPASMRHGGPEQSFIRGGFSADAGRGSELHASRLSASNGGSMNGSRLHTSTGGRRLLADVMHGRQGEAGVGIGVDYLKQGDSSVIEIVQVTEGEAADESGEVFVGNVLVSVDELPLRQMNIDQVLSLVNGPQGSKVSLGLLRSAGSLGGLPDQDVVVSVELVRGDNERVREEQRLKEDAEKVQREEWTRASMERQEELRIAAEEEEDRQMLKEQQDMQKMQEALTASETPAVVSAIRFTGPGRIVVLTRKWDRVRDRVGLGLSLTTVHPSGEVLVAGLTEGGAAHDSKQVVVGDVLHQVDNVSVQGKKVEQVVEMIRGPPGSAVVLLLQGTTLDPTVLDPNDSAVHQSVNGGGGSMARNQAQNPKSVSIPLVRKAASLGAVTPSTQSGEVQGGLGIGIGVTQDGVHFVNGLMNGGSAEESGLLHRGDRILAIDDVPTTGRSVEEVIALVRGRPGSTAILTVERGAMLDKGSLHDTGRTMLTDTSGFATVAHSPPPPPPESPPMRTKKAPEQAQRSAPPRAPAKEPAEEEPLVMKKAPHRNTPVRSAPPPAKASPLATTAEVEMVLDMEFDEVMKNEQEFRQSVCEDVANAVGGDKDKVRILSIRAGSVITELALDEGVCQDGRSLVEITQNLQRQSLDPNSALKKGKYTQRVKDFQVTRVPVSISSPEPSTYPSVPLSERVGKLVEYPPDQMSPSQSNVESHPMADDISFEIPPTDEIPIGAGVVTPRTDEPRRTQTYNVRVVSGTGLLSLSKNSRVTASFVRCNMKVVNEKTGAVSVNHGTVVEGPMREGGAVAFRGVPRDVTVFEDEVPDAVLIISVWDLAGDAAGCLGECRLPLEKLPLAKDLKVSCPVEDPVAVPPEGWAGQAEGDIDLRILSLEPDMGWKA